MVVRCTLHCGKRSQRMMSCRAQVPVVLCTPPLRTYRSLDDVSVNSLPLRLQAVEPTGTSLAVSARLSGRCSADAACHWRGSLLDTVQANLSGPACDSGAARNADRP
jgi:hypothetical protein